MRRTITPLRHLGSLLTMQLVIAACLTLLALDPPWGIEALLETFTVNLLFTVAISGLTTAVFDLLLPRLRWPRGAMIAAHIAGFAVSVAVGMELALFVLSGLGRDHEVDRVSAWRVATVVTAVALLIGFAFDRLRAHARAVELREELAQRELVQAQLETLRARLHPHFLFNSLNALAGLIEEDPPRAVLALEQLSALLRRGLEAGTDRKAQLSDELDAVRDYFSIAELRFGERLRWWIEVSPDVLGARVPSLLLQPLVENAIKYAVAPRRGGASVFVTARDRGGKLHLEVRDDGPGTAGQVGTNLGHRTLLERLALEYGERASVTAGPLPGGGYRVEVALPLEVAPP